MYIYSGYNFFVNPTLVIDIGFTYNDNFKIKREVTDFNPSLWCVERDILSRVLIIPMIFTHLIFTDLINSNSIGILEGCEKLTILGGFLPLSPREPLHFY